MLYCMYYDFDPAHFLSMPGLAWLVCLKLKRAKLVLLYDIDMLQMVVKRIRSGIRHAIPEYAKANNKSSSNTLGCKQFTGTDKVSEITCTQF